MNQESAKLTVSVIIMNSALAIRNLMDAFLRYGQPKRFVHVSSFAVYSNLHLKRGALLDETCPLEDAPQERYDAYGFGKLKQEELVKAYGDQHKLRSTLVLARILPLITGGLSMRRLIGPLC
jgi:nucleoside-diphosphate-sugar epimerase